MRPSLIALPLLFLATSASAQVTSVARETLKRPRESCGKERVETVVVSDERGQSNAAHDRIAGEVNYWFRPAPAVSVRSTVYAVVLSRTGIDIAQQQPAGDTAFDRVTRQAVDAAAHEHAFDALLADGSASAKVLVYFGTDATGRMRKFANRTVCDAEPMPSNPKPMFPLELQPPPASANAIRADTKQVTWGEVVARFLVDTTGAVDPATFAVVKATNPLFVREVQRVLPILRYFPAEIAGRAAPEVIEQRFEFTVR